MAAAAPKAAEASNALPPNREKNLNRRPGFEYMILRLDFEKGSKFGLGIKHYQNKVRRGALAHCILIAARD